MHKRNIVSYYELSDAWQEEATTNLQEHAKEAAYLEPLPEHTPGEHILWDLTEVMPVSGPEPMAAVQIFEGHETEQGAEGGVWFYYNGTMAISNNSAMLLNIDTYAETAEVLFV